jgi:hypothetical protein
MPLAGLHFRVGLDFVTPSLSSFLSKHHHHVTQGDDKTFINWQTIALDKQKDKFWSTVEDDTDGIFDCLGMFNE